jgi:hypothetical protein
MCVRYELISNVELFLLRLQPLEGLEVPLSHRLLGYSFLKYVMSTVRLVRQVSRQVSEMMLVYCQVAALVAHRPVREEQVEGCSEIASA